MSIRNTTSRLLSTSNVRPVGGVVSPQSLANLAAWWDFSNAEYLATATNGTGTVSNGSAIAYCADRSGNARHVIQATANNRPTWSSTGLNSLGTGSFNGSTNFLVTSASFAPWTGDQPFSWGAVYTRATATSGWFASTVTLVGNNSSVLLADAYNASFTANRSLIYGGTNILWLTTNQTTGTGFVISGTTAAGARNVTNVWRNGTQSHALVSVPTNTLSAASSNVDVGRAYVAGNQYHNGLLAELVIYSRVLLTAELTSLTRYLGTKWGITVA